MCSTSSVAYTALKRFSDSTTKPTFRRLQSIMESLWEDGSYTRELMLCEGLVQRARREIKIIKTGSMYTYYKRM